MYNKVLYKEIHHVVYLYICIYMYYRLKSFRLYIIFYIKLNIIYIQCRLRYMYSGCVRRSVLCAEENSIIFFILFFNWDDVNNDDLRVTFKVAADLNLDNIRLLIVFWTCIGIRVQHPHQVLICICASIYMQIIIDNDNNY